MKVKENPQADNVRQMYSLAEAAALIGNSVSHILSLGGDGHLPIYARIPEDIQAYRTNDALLGRNNGIYAGLLQRVHIQQFASGIRPRLLSDATFLLLHPNTCRLVAAHGEAYQLDFPGAFRFSEELDLTLIDQPRTGMGTNAVDIGTEFIVCYLRNREPFILGMPTDATPVSIRLAVSALRVCRSDLANYGLNSDNAHPRFDNGFSEEPQMSKKLLELNEAAMRFWDCSRADWASPSNADVATWLMGEDRKWGVKTAKAAATILRDSYENWDQDEYECNRAKVAEEKQGKPVSFAPTGLNKFDAVVYVAQHWKNADLQQGERTEKLETYPNRSEILRLLQNKYGFASYLAKAAWRIVSPEGAIKEGRPRSAE